MLDRSLGLDVPEHHSGEILTECAQTDRFPRRGIVESTRWMVLHRPFELVPLIGEVTRNSKIARFMQPSKAARPREVQSQ